MAKTKVTLPTIDEIKQKPFALRDWARSNGARCSKDDYMINGKKQTGGYSWSRVADHNGIRYNYNDEGFGWTDGGYRRNFAFNRGNVVRPRFQNPEKSGIDISNERGNENSLTINGRTAYYPGTKITGDVQVIRSINLQFGSDETSIDTFDDNMPYTEKRSESYEVVVDGIHGYATKLEHTNIPNNSIYSDGTKVKWRQTVWHWLDPVKAERQQDGSIQINEGILPVQFETQDKYEAQNIKDGTILDTDKFQVGRVLRTILAELEKSAEVMAELITHKAKKTTFANKTNLMKKAGKGQDK